MRRTTVRIPDGLDARLRHEAARRGATISEVTRDALAEYLGDDPAGSGGRRRLGAAGTGHSGRSDISEQIEEIIAAEVSR